jgi:phytol kinase
VILLKHFGLGDMAAVGCAVLAMGYGDGLASLVGKAVKSKRLGSWTKKTYAGSITMVCVTMIVVILMKVFIGGVSFTGTLVLKAALVAVFAALVEAFTPFGLDNMSVPIAIFLVMRFV